ncbi:MAG: hypothetical protein FD180_2999 [Planctomycetota bacterium]|nr:MAG: hypothetical protein FD180_2999 [Planctomycetota bacterium]
MSSRPSRRSTSPVGRKERSVAAAGNSAPEPASTLKRWAPVVLPALAALAIARERFADLPWHDEVYTLNVFATSVGKALTDYHAPNNHVLFSAALALWRDCTPGDESLLSLRLLPALCFALSAGVLAAAVRRMAGSAFGAAAGCLFASLHVTQNFALQLRGYGPSWLPLAGALWAAVAWIESPRAALLALFAACAAISVGIVPTNVFPALALGAWAAWHAFRRGKRAEAAVFALAPLAGALFYAAVLPQLGAQAAGFAPRVTRIEFTLEWIISLAKDLGWLVPAAAIGLAALLKRMRVNPAPGVGAKLGLILAVAAAALATAVLLPHAPYPRVLVPALPLFCAAIAILCREAIAGFRAVPVHRAGVALAAAAFVIGLAREAAAKAPLPGTRPHSLYLQYFHRGFRPDLALESAADAGNGGTVLALTDDADLLALTRAARAFPALDVRYSGTFAPTARGLASARSAVVAVIATDESSARSAVRMLGAVDLSPVADTGFFKVWRVTMR